MVVLGVPGIRQKPELFCPNISNLAIAENGTSPNAAKS